MGGLRKSKHLVKNSRKTKNHKNFRNAKNNNNMKKHHKKKGDNDNRKQSFNRYRDKSQIEQHLAKKKEIDEKMQQYETSESEDEALDPMQKLLSTFSANDNNYKSNINSDDEEDTVSESDDNAMDVEIDQNDANNIPELNSEINNSDVKNATKEINEETIEEEELDLETEKDDNSDASSDPFTRHLRYDLDELLLESVSSIPQIANVSSLEWPKLGKMIVQIPKCQNSNGDEKKTKVTLLEKEIFTQPGKVPVKMTSNWDKLHVKPQIQPQISFANKMSLLRKECEPEEQLTDLQKEIFSIINNYQDFHYPQRSVLNAEEIRFTYCLHALNHILKTRTKILHHNARLSKKEEVSDDFRDQGLVRPKVLIVVPFRDSAYKVIKTLIDLLVSGNASQVINKNRFENDFTGGELLMPKKNPKPEDYELTFSGNSDDTFRIGLSVTKKTLKLYTDFYSSDIIIASPLGLRVIIGADGEEERDFDFLASIEILILDQVEVFLMQNWDHLLHIFNHLHLQPKKTHGTDFSRLRSWAVNGWAKYYRQTMLFSSISLPEINSLLNKKCFNYAGKIKVHNAIESGSIRQVALQIPQMFRRIEAKDPISAIDDRFNYFINEILPQYKDSIMSHTMIYVPSYFDYVRIRNYFKKEDVSFVQICEYSKDAKIARARDIFFHTEAHFLLYSERFHFFRRMRIKGIRHIIFFQPPIFPHFYSELCNLMQEANQNKYGGSESNMTISVLYTKYDLQQLSALVGSERTMKMAQSDKNVHMFMTGD